MPDVELDSLLDYLDELEGKKSAIEKRGAVSSVRPTQNMRKRLAQETTPEEGEMSGLSRRLRMHTNLKEGVSDDLNEEAEMAGLKPRVGVVANAKKMAANTALNERAHDGEMSGLTKRMHAAAHPKKTTKNKAAGQPKDLGIDDTDHVARLLDSGFGDAPSLASNAPAPDADKVNDAGVVVKGRTENSSELIDGLKKLQEEGKRNRGLNLFIEGGMDVADGFNTSRKGAIDNSEFTKQLNAIDDDAESDYIKRIEQQLKLNDDDREAEMQPANLREKNAKASLEESNAALKGFELETQKDLADPNSVASQAAVALANQFGLKTPDGLTAAAMLALNPVAKEMLRVTIEKAQISAANWRNERDNASSERRNAANNFSAESRNREDNQTSLLKTAIGQESKNSYAQVMAGFVDAKNRELAFRFAERLDRDWQPVDGTIPTLTNLNKFRTLSQGVKMLATTLTRMKDLYDRTGSEHFYGEEYNQLKSDYLASLKEQQKIDQNGVLSGPEWDILTKQFSDPSGARALFDKSSFPATIERLTRQASDKLNSAAAANNLIPRKDPMPKIELNPTGLADGTKTKEFIQTTNPSISAQSAIDAIAKGGSPGDIAGRLHGGGGKSGGTTEKKVRMINPEGRTVLVLESRVDAAKQAGGRLAE